MKTLVKMNFNPEIAKDVGVDAAIILENIAYWIDKNRANQINKENKPSFQDGSWWTYNSMEAFLSQFTWLTIDQLRTRLKTLEEKKYIKTGNYNKNKYDRTKWYSLGTNPFLNYYKSIWENSQIESVSIPNRKSENPKPIPNDNTDYKRERALSQTDIWKAEEKKFKKALFEIDESKFVTDYFPAAEVAEDAKRCFRHYYALGKAPANWKPALQTWLNRGKDNAWKNR